MLHLFSATFSLRFVAVVRISKEHDVGLNQNKLHFHRSKGHFHLKRLSPSSIVWLMFFSFSTTAELCVIEKEDISD